MHDQSESAFMFWGLEAMQSLEFHNFKNIKLSLYTLHKKMEFNVSDKSKFNLFDQMDMWKPLNREMDKLDIRQSGRDLGNELVSKCIIYIG